MRIIELNTSLIDKTIEGLRAGDKVMLNGNILVARDQAHLRLNEMIKKELELPIEIENQIIYYAGPSPAKPGEHIGAIGPTTSARMDGMTKELFKLGLRGSIGKGERSPDIQKLITKYKSPYFVAVGAAAMYESVEWSKLIAFEDLGPEAIYRLTVKNMPLYVAYDIYGNSIYT